MAATLSSSLFFLHSSLSSTTKKAVLPKTIALFPTLPVKPCVLFSKTRSSFVRNVVMTPRFDQEAGVHVTEGRRDREDLKLFVGNLSFGVDSADLAELFGQAGTVELVEVIYDKETGRSRGFGFVTMSAIEEVEAAAQQFNGYDLDGRPLRVNFGPPPPRRDGPPPRRDGSSSRRDGPPPRREGSSSRRDGGPPTRVGFRNGSGSDSGNRIYVGNLSWGVDDLALENLFNEKGRVVEAKVVYDRETGRSRGFGFVTYNSAEEVNSAVSSLNGIDLDGRSIRVTVAEARAKRQY